MQVKQFPITATNSSLQKQQTDIINAFLRQNHFLGFEYSVVARTNPEGQQLVVGQFILKYEARPPRLKEIVQIVQFPLRAEDPSLENSLNEFLSDVPVRDVKYDAVRVNNAADKEIVQGLALVVYGKSF
ncbi:hypothetical protein ACFL1B_02195 [Nanoarchaeota archaeon]